MQQQQLIKRIGLSRGSILRLSSNEFKNSFKLSKRNFTQIPINNANRFSGLTINHLNKNNFLRTYSSETKSGAEAEKNSEKENKKNNDESEKTEKSEKSEKSNEIDELTKKIQQKEKEVAELKDKYLRSIADFRNLQEVTKRENKSAKEFAITKFAKDLLESIDNFDRAMGIVPEKELEAKGLKDLIDGLKMTQHVLVRTLEKHGVSKIYPIDEVFDPNKHEATFQHDQPDKEPGTVFFVQQTGYALNDRVLRPAKVGVVKSRD